MVFTIIITVNLNVTIQKYWSKCSLVQGQEFTGARKADVRERQRLIQLVQLQAQEIDALKEEIMLLSRKGGHILPPAQPPLPQSPPNMRPISNWVKAEFIWRTSLFNDMLALRPLQILDPLFTFNVKCMILWIHIQECDILFIHIFRPYIYKLEDNDIEVCNLW